MRRASEIYSHLLLQLPALHKLHRAPTLPQNAAHASLILSGGHAAGGVADEAADLAEADAAEGDGDLKGVDVVLGVGVPGLRLRRQERQGGGVIGTRLDIRGVREGCRTKKGCSPCLKT